VIEGIVTEDNFGIVMTGLAAYDGKIGVDTETSGLNTRSGADYLMGWCFDIPGISVYAPFRHHKGNLPLRYLDHIKDIVTTKDLVWHNRKFDMHSSKTCGIDPMEFKGHQSDTLMMAQLVNEELYSKELDALSQRYLKEGKYKKDAIKEMGKALGFENMPVEAYEKYGGMDANLTRRLEPIFSSELVKQELQDVYNTEAKFTEVLYSLEQRGVGVRPDFCSERAERGRGRMATIRRELKLNPSSPTDLGKYLIEELELPVLAHTDSCDACKSGQPLHSHKWRPSFNKKVMEDYDDILQESNNPAAQRIAEYRGWQKAVTSLYEPMLEKVGPDGLIRTEFKQHGTVTGRISSFNPNLQQLPRSSNKPWNGDAKSAFTSGRDDFDLIGWDYSQLELRIAAAYGSEALLLAEFEKRDADVFNVLAPLVFGVLTPETRHDTKTFTYANLYGAGLRKIAAQLGRGMDETKSLYDNYKRSISGIIEVSQNVTRLVEQRGYVKYWDGRRRHIRNKREAYKAWNSVCQGGGAQLVKHAMIRCREFEDENCFMVLQVHDEITFAIRKGMRAKYEPLIVRAMTDFPAFGVNFAVEGKEWGKAA
jgi:DNA polymerase-1